MVIVQLAGGLGNQMFQYALYLQLKSLGREVKVDDVSGVVEDIQREPALAPFGVTYERPTKKELIKMLDSSMLPWQRVRRKLFGRHKKSYFEESKLFAPEVLTWDDIYLEGYWQTEQYFHGVENQVREVYDPERLIVWLQREGRWSESAARYLQEIDNECSVSIHVRRGDYLTPENQALFGGICTDAYYIEGIRRMRELYPGCKFYLFCNDKEWESGGAWKADGIEKVMLSGNQRDIDYAEFALMSRCRHHILANSSFSWWASYLNPDPKKTVLVPDRWLNGIDCRDYYREDMQKIIV
ncbi:MAG: alpha-1,2-fucosyltransferase [Lachnospiraceae bacterium]|nr:alpha-1,2-fucosyltransferase [Lachnospiraceae bacterium]